MATIHTDGRALADAATLARKITGKMRRTARLTVIEGRAELETTDGLTGIVEVVGVGSAIDGADVSIAADLDGWSKLRTAGPITIRETTDGHAMTVGAATLTLADAGEMETWPKLGVSDTISVDVSGHEAATVVDELRSVAAACGTGADGRTILTTVAIRSGEAAATDGYRLNVSEIPAVGGRDVVGLIPSGWLTSMPRKGVDRLTIVAGADGRACELTYRVTSNDRTRRVSIVGITDIHQTYPNWPALIKERDGTYTSVTIPVGLRDALRRMTSPVVMTVGLDSLTVADTSGASATIGTAIATGSVALGPVGANPEYLVDLIDYIGDGGSLYIRSEGKAMAATAAGRTALLMPMKTP